MQRLDGQKKSKTPLLIGLLALAALVAGGYYYSQSNNSPNAVASNPRPAGDTASVGTNPTIGSQTVGASATPEATSTETTPGETSGVTPKETSVTPAANTPADSTAVGDVTDTTSNAANSRTALPSTVSSATASDQKDVISKRSKTITNDKKGTTVTYSKEVRRDGSVTHNKETSATPVR